MSAMNPKYITIITAVSVNAMRQRCAASARNCSSGEGE
jgi:hypothetical protein